MGATLANANPITDLSSWPQLRSERKKLGSRCVPGLERCAVEQAKLKPVQNGSPVRILLAEVGERSIAAEHWNAPAAFVHGKESNANHHIRVHYPVPRSRACLASASASCVIRRSAASRRFAHSA